MLLTLVPIIREGRIAASAVLELSAISSTTADFADAYLALTEAPPGLTEQLPRLEISNLYGSFRNWMV